MVPYTQNIDKIKQYAVQTLQDCLVLEERDGQNKPSKQRVLRYCARLVLSLPKGTDYVTYYVRGNFGSWVKILNECCDTRLFYLIWQRYKIHYGRQVWDWDARIVGISAYCINQFLAGAVVSLRAL